jgi:hypothetical protein
MARAGPELDDLVPLREPHAADGGVEERRVDEEALAERLVEALAARLEKAPEGRGGPGKIHQNSIWNPRSTRPVQLM